MDNTFLRSCARNSRTQSEPSLLTDIIPNRLVYNFTLNNAFLQGPVLNSGTKSEPSLLTDTVLYSLPQVYETTYL